MRNLYYETVHSFVGKYYLFIALLLFSYNNKGPLFYTFYGTKWPLCANVPIYICLFVCLYWLTCLMILILLLSLQHSPLVYFAKFCHAFLSNFLPSDCKIHLDQFRTAMLEVRLNKPLYDGCVNNGCGGDLGLSQDFKNACPKQQIQNICPSRFSH